MALFGNTTTTSAPNSTTILGTTTWSTSPTGKTPVSVFEEPRLIVLLAACISAGLWLIYLTLYHARILGFALTRFVNFKYVKDGYFKVGSISFSILSGKVMFRDVCYITKDLSLRIVDGFVFFKYWMPFDPIEWNKPYQHTLADIETAFTDYRLSVWLNGLEYHVYNRSQLYHRLRDIFNIDRYGDAAKSVIDLQAESKVDTTDMDTKESSQGGLPTWFLELVPAIKIDLSIGKVAFGNKNMETTLCFQFESATGMYTTAQPSSAADHFTHVVKCRGKNVKVMLSPSPGYNGPRDEPPRYMGEGFVVLQTADCKIMYYQDEPGIVAELAPEDDVNIPDSDPHWGIDVAFVKGTSLSYGPWVDRQRDFLQKFFYPMDFQEMPATKPLAPGQRRLHTGLDIKFDFECDATLDILFSKNRETKAVHVCVDSGSYIRVYQPWTVNEYGYTTSVVAKLLQVEATTGLEYRSLFEADSLDLAVHMAFPRVWNQTQHWSCDITISKVSWYFIFAHKWFFQDMIEDWSSNYRADLLQFVPYEWAFNIVLKDFEMIWLGNQHNWIDTTTGWQGNAELAFCGELFDLTFALQFFRFLPEIEEIKFFLQVEKLVARTVIPESNTLRRSFLALARSNEKRPNLPFRSYSTTSTGANPEEGIESCDENPAAAADGALSGDWRRHTSISTGWVDVMSVPVLGLSLGYVYHPVLPHPCAEVPKDGCFPFDPYELESDVITLELEAGPAALKLMGPLLKVLAAIKENYFGIDQVFHEFGSFSLSKKHNSNSEGEQNKSQGLINPYLLRPLEANIYASLYDCKAQLAKHCGQNEPSCPLLLFERMMFEMHKTYTETRLQLHLTPLTLLADDGLERGGCNSHLSRGHLCLSGFQLRGHAMFSGEGLPVGSETLEYCWLVELQLGMLTGKVTLPQLESIATWLQTFAFQVVNKENELDPVSPYHRCIHGNQQNMCTASKKLSAPPLSTSGSGGDSNSVKGRESAGATPKGTLERKTDHVPTELCLTEDELKYKFTRVSIEKVDLFFVESGCACNLEIAPIRLATCNLHNNESSAGASLFIHTVKLRQFVLTPCPNTFEDMLSNVHKRSSMYEQDVTWLEAASIQLGPVISDISMATSSPNRYHQQKHFLEMHDKGFQRLWFLWQADERYSYKRHGCCGCVGGCSFFGRNANGPKFFMPGKLDASENDTGVTGFGSEDGFYEDGDLVDVSSRPLMYSRDGSLERVDSVMDRTPVGSIEAFTRRRYKHGSGSSGSPRLPRANPRYLGPSPPYSFTEGGGAGEEEDGSRRTSRYSYGSSLQRANSSLGNIQERMRYMHNASLQGSKGSLERNNKASKTSFKPPRHRSLSQLSRESDASFYSCGSLLDEIGMNQRDGARRTTSVDSFVSAVEDPIELMDFEDGQVSLSKFVINSPELVSKYARHLAQLDCLNWASSSLAPGDRKKFSLAQNLKEMESEETSFLPPGIPQFNYQNPPKLSFPLLVKKSQRQKYEGQANEDDGMSSSSDGSVFMFHETTLKVPSFGGKDIDKGKYDGSSEMVEQTEQDSARKARWSFAMNTGNRNGLSGTSSFDNMLDGAPNQAETKLPKEGTAVIKVAGDVNILVTPLLLEALQRYIFSVEKQSGVLHPATVVDLVHDKCMDAAEQAFLAREPERKLTAGQPHVELAVPEREMQGDKTTLVFLSTSKINICFLQAASSDPKLNENVDAPSPDPVCDKNRTPIVSLLAGTISGITSEVMNVKNRTLIDKLSLDGHEEFQQDKLPKVSLTDPQGHSFEERSSGKKIGVREHVSTIGVVNCNSVQFQLRKLCDKSDIENSVTTAIPEEASRAKFKVNGSNQVFYSHCFDIDSLDRSQSLSLLMLECGVDNIAIEAGSECGSGNQVLSKINRSWISNKQNGFIPKVQSTAATPPKQDRQEFHGFSNPIFERDTGSVAININLPDSQRKSQDTLSQSSSVSATISLSSSSSGGNVSDVESDSDQEMRKPLLSPDGGAGSKPQTDEKVDAVKEPDCAQRNDILVKFSNIWVNMASPSSFKAVPANYHLYNSLVTTIVPVVTAWAPLVAGLGEAVAAMECNRKRHISSVIACLLAQALPDGRLPGKHSVCPRATDVAKFIQEDYSSQLIYILRRQLSGSRLAKVRNALLIKSGIPDDANLVKGIFALARQWKCFLAGTEKGELAFDGSNSIKRRVVGRGVLTDRDRAILMQGESLEKDDSKTPRHQPSQVAFSQQSYVESSPRDGETEPLLEPQEDQGSAAQVDQSQKGTRNVEVRQAEQETPLRRPDSLQIPQDPNLLRVSPKVSRYSASKLPQPEPAHDSESDSDATPTSTIRKPLRSGPNQSLLTERQKLGHKKQLSLYSWLSNTPTTSPPSSSSQARTAAPRESEESAAATKVKVQIIDERLSSPNSNLFGDMVSVPTSGKQIADERDIFKSLFQSIQLMPALAKNGNSASTISVNTRFKYLNVDLVEGGFDNLTKKGKEKESKSPKKSTAPKQLFTDHEPVFMAKDFAVKVVCDMSPTSVSLRKDLGETLITNSDSSKLTQVRFTVSSSIITQRVNLSFVRLLIQIVDMLDLLLEPGVDGAVCDELDGPSPRSRLASSTPSGYPVTPQTSALSARSPMLPKCWRIMYQVLDLYSSLPKEAKVKGFMRRSIFGTTSYADRPSPDRPKEIRIDMEDGNRLSQMREGHHKQNSLDQRRSVASYSTRESKSTEQEDSTFLPPSVSIFGVVSLPKTRFLATIGGLVLETEIKDIGVSISHKEEKVAGSDGPFLSSVLAHLGKIHLVLLEKTKVQTGTVVSCHLSRSQAMYTAASRVDSEKNMAVVTLGVVDIDIPQHPVALHSMMTRSSRTISRHITEIQSQRSVIRSMGSFDAGSPRLSRRLSGVPTEFWKHRIVGTPTSMKQFSTPSTPIGQDSVDSGVEPSIPTISFTFVFRGFALGAALLPSLRAEYKIGRITSSGRTGAKSSFKVSMPQHNLSFTSKIQAADVNVPSSTVVELPPVNVSGEFLSRVRQPRAPRLLHQPHRTPTKGHLFAKAEIGAFQHSLTTDLLNHLVFVQKSFMKEVSDVVQRVSGESQPVPLWRTASAESLDPDKGKKMAILYSFELKLKGIQVTATTPSSTALRLDTGVMALEVSNALPTTQSLSGKLRRSNSHVRLFGKAQVDVNLSLGQFVKSRVIDNESDFQQLAYFKTRIGLRNSFQDGSSMYGTEDKETFLVTLTKPYLYVQQISFDKAVLVYLNYKNAYEHWNQQRLALNKEVHTATQVVLEKLPQRGPAAQLTGSLFLQLTVDRLGVCTPLFANNLIHNPMQGLKTTDQDPGPAMVLTVEEMLLTCCSSVSFVSRGKFKEFCIRFEDKFNTEATEWEPSPTQTKLMNTCKVPEGTYELCSKTMRYPATSDAAKAGKWVMSIHWQMRGIEVECDTEIGKYLSSLGQTLTALAGETDIANMESVTDIQDQDRDTRKEVNDEDGKDEVDAGTHYAREKLSMKSLEKEMWAQAKKVNELRRRSDIENWIVEKEAMFLQELESAVFNEFRRDVRKKLRRHSRTTRNTVQRRDSDKQLPQGRKAMSERVRGSRTRSRLRKRSRDVETDAEENEMVEMTAASAPSSPGDVMVYLNRKEFQQGATDEQGGMACSALGPPGRLSPSLPDVTRPSQLLGPSSVEDPLPFRSTPYGDGATGSPRVTFNTGGSDTVQDQTGQRPSTVQQNLDFELDVKVDIESGLCILHPATDPDKEPDANDARSYSKRSTPVDNARSKTPGLYYMGQRRYKKDNQEKSSQPDDTVLFLPAVDVRVQYHSGMNTSVERDRLSTSGGSFSQPVFEESSSMISTDLEVESDSSTLLAPPSPEQDTTVWDSTATTSLTTPPKRLIKRAGLYTWISFQSLPQEMILKPCLLDFLGQALEPIVPADEEFVDAGESLTSDADSVSGGDPEATGSMVSSSMSENSSFPVDIVVVIRVQPSEIRFSCLPVSRVECMLNLPDLDVVFSSNSSPNKYLQQASNRPPSRDQSRLRIDQLDSSTTSSFTFDSGGISFTVCLSRLSFCIFHPYGKEHDGVGRTPSTDEEAAEEGMSQARYIPTQAKSGKKDSLSLNVEFIKFNLSRRRLGKAVDFPDDRSTKSGSSDFLGGSSVVKVSGICDIGSANFYYDMRRLNEILDFPKAWYKRSLFSRLFLGKEGVYATRTATTASSDVTDAPPTGRTEEPNRMTPLIEIPSIERVRPTLGRSMSEEDPKSLTPFKSPQPKKTHKKVPSTGSSLFGLIPTSPSLFRSVTMSGTRHSLLTPGGPMHSPPTPRRQTFSGDKIPKASEHESHTPGYSSSDDVDGPLSHSSTSSSGGSKTKWETMIVVALNLSRLDVATNMSSVMGQTFWSTSDLRATGRLTLTNTGRRNLKAKLTIRQAKCGSRSGIVGGHIEVYELLTRVKANEERGYPPEHQVNVRLKYTEARIDYMGTCIWMGNVAAFCTDLRDEWILHQATSPSTDSLFGSGREEPVNAKIYMHGELAWNDFKVMICRSTTPDFVKMITKIQDFFAQQHRNSMRALSSLHTPSLGAGSIMSQLSAPITSHSLKKGKAAEKDGLKYQHWSKVLNAVCGLQLSTLSNPLPERGVLLGGSLTLRGQSVSLACFHGVNFRAQSWVLFTLSSPFMEFSSRVCSVEKSCQVRRVRAVQNLLIRIGHGDVEDSVPGNLSPNSAHIAIVRKVSRGRRNPPSMGSHVQEWLNYVCATGDEDFSTTDDILSTERTRADSTGSMGSRKSSSIRRTSSSYRYEHETEPIFALPKFEVVLKTEHDLPMSAIPSTWARNRKVSVSRMMATPASPHVVECSFTSCFDDSLCVTMDVGLLFFLHDVVQTYIRENETTSSGSLPRGTSPTSHSRSTARREDKTGKEDRESTRKTEPEPKSKRTRQFRSKAWKLEPRVRFLSWAGKNMEPVNIDWVLQKLGFTDAQLTIPKWAQRGAMDPMDLFLSLLIDRLLAGMKESSAYLGDV